MYTDRGMTGYACYVRDRQTQKHTLVNKYPDATPSLISATTATSPTPAIDLDVDTRHLRLDSSSKIYYVSTDRQDYIFKVKNLLGFFLIQFNKHNLSILLTR